MCILWCSLGLALDPGLMLSQYSQRTWTREDGLPQNSVLAITQSSDGYLWIGTEQGLVRFDGIRFVTVELLTADGRADSYVTSLLSDFDTIWVGTRSGLYGNPSGRFTEIVTNDGGSLGLIVAIHRDAHLQLWAGGIGGLYRVDGETSATFVNIEGEEFGGVTSISESPDSRLCLAKAKVYCLEDGNFNEQLFVTEAVGNSRTETLVFDETGALWVGTNGRGLLRFDGDTIDHWDTSNGLPHGFVRTLMVDRTGNIWFGSGSSGVVRLARDRPEVLDVPRGQSGTVVALFPDREENLWIGTNGDGLVRLSGGLFTPFSVAEGLREPSVNTVLEDPEGVVWVGTAGGGLHRLDNGRIDVLGEDNGLPAEDVISLELDSRGRLWVGTGGAGAFVQDGPIFVPVEGSGRVVFSLHEDFDGRMWAGFLGGVSRLEGRVFNAISELQDINVSAITSRREREVWFANAYGGPIVWRDGEVTRFGGPQGYPDDLTIALYLDAAGGTWIGTHLGGLTFVRGNGPFTFTTEHGLCDNSIFSILEDDFGRMWMSSNLGVFTVARAELEAVARGETSRVDCRLFGVTDGLRSAECNGGQSPSAWKDHTGKLWFATVDGVSWVDPLEIVDVEAPPVLIEELTSNDTNIVVPLDGTPVQLTPSQRNLAIRYTAMTLSLAEGVRFRYRLGDFDEDWVEAGERRVAFYTNLPPRSYRFQVQARVPGSSWGEPGASLDLLVEPRFTETRWFFVLVALVMISLAAAAHRGRVAVLRRRQRRLQKRSRNAHSSSRMSTIPSNVASKKALRRYARATAWQPTGTWWPA